MNAIVLAILMAVTVEGLVEYGSTIYKAFCNGEVKTAVKQIAACVAGIVLCVLVGADFYAGIGVTFKVAITGTVLTGIFVSRGANYVSDLVKKFQSIADGGYDVLPGVELVSEVPTEK